LEQKQMTPTSGYITTLDGVRLFFQKLGSGARTIVILNGFYLLEDFKRLANQHTVISLDLRNRGQSEYITDSSKLQGGFQQDVDDMEFVRQHFGLDQLNLIGHSYTTAIVMLYAIKHTAHTGRIVQIGAVPPDGTKQYAPHLMNTDSTLSEFFAQVQELEKERASTDPVEFCKKFWKLLRVIYVANPADAAKLNWKHLCNLPTELNVMKYYLEVIAPSLQAMKLTSEELQVVKSPVLTIHGTKDRSAPYGAALDWTEMLPNAQLLTIEGAAHVPWIEAPDQVFGAIETFFRD
jgi:pimeloyl-ACP methyl ester carboxylesterase